jgi:TolA-binding protein
MLNAAPAHSRAPEAMLAISNVQIELKDTKAARKTLDDLTKTYPTSEAAVTARERIARLR